jgi:hypothetical protein
MSKFTAWYPMATKPVRFGEYEGREKGSGLRMPVYWRQLQDEPNPGWYFDKGYLGPFHLWEPAEKRMTGWRGLKENPNKEPA